MKLLSFAALAAILAAPLAVRAEEHPAYLHALTDLRHARAHLEKPAKPSVAWDEQGAISEIDKAIGEIKKASIDDGKDLNDHPPVDAGLDHAGRLHRAIELLRKARADIEKGEDDRWGNHLRARAFEHIDAAIRKTREAIHDKEK